MKKHLATGTLLAALALSVALPVSAATIQMQAPMGQVRAGQDFSVVVRIDPQGKPNYTAKVELQYPADTLEVKSFTNASGWMALVQPGYDSIDNSSGMLIKSAGYPGGFSAAQNFGTVVFTAKKTGSVSIGVGANSLVLDENSSNTLVASAPLSVTVAGAPASAARPAPAPVAKSSAAAPAPAASAPASEVAPAPEQSAPPASQSNAASVGAIDGANVALNIAIAVLILLVVLGYLYYRYRTKNGSVESSY